MFLKIVFFFLILNVVLGFTVGFLNNAYTETGNPNTTIFLERGIDQNDVIAPLGGQNLTYSELVGNYKNGTGNVTKFHASQFNPPENGTGGIVQSIQEFFSVFDFLNVSEMQRWLNYFNVFFVLSVADNIMQNIGVADFPPGLLDALGVVLTFAAIVWFIFIVFGRAPSGFT